VTEMLPCPNPDCPYPFAKGHLGVDADRHIPYAWQVICPCGASGPRGDSDDHDEAMELAIVAWNRMPRGLVWSSEPPKVPGDYKARYARHPKQTRMIRVSARSIAEAPPEFWQGQEFAGPYPEPVEPETPDPPPDDPLERARVVLNANRYGNADDWAHGFSGRAGLPVLASRKLDVALLDSDAISAAKHLGRPNLEPEGGEE